MDNLSTSNLRMDSLSLDNFNMSNFSMNNLRTSNLSMDSLTMDTLSIGKRFAVGYQSRTASEQKSEHLTAAADVFARHHFFKTEERLSKR
jgi:hypothetical protein